MTAVRRLDRVGDTRAEQVEHLRRKMAAVTGKVGGGHRGQAPADPVRAGVLPDSESLLPLPDSLAETLPGSLPRGSVVVLSGARSLPLSMVAAVTAAGGYAAIVGQPDVGLLAAVEMGADLSRLAVVPDPGTDPVEVAAVLMDGMDLVVLGLGGRSVPAGRARAVTARARQQGCTLLVTGGDWQGARHGWRPGSAATKWPVRAATRPPAGLRADRPGAAGDAGPRPVDRTHARGRRRIVACRGCWPSGAWTGPRSPRRQRRGFPRRPRWR